MSQQSYGPPPDPNPEQSSPPPDPGQDYTPPMPPTYPPPPPRPWWHYLILLLLFVGGIWLGTTLEGCETNPPTEVTRIVEVTTAPGPTNSPEPGAAETVEVTRIVTQIVPVTAVITATVPASPLTTVITNTVETTREVEVTRIVPVTTVVTDTVEITRIVTRIILTPPTVVTRVGQGCTRFDLEVGRNRFDGTPVGGTYYLVERPFSLDDNVIASWEAQKGDLDSGWIEGIYLSAESVHVQVWFYPSPQGAPILLEIVNHAPGMPYGWLTHNLCHALEVQFPE